MFICSLVKDTINTVKESVFGSKPSNNTPSEADDPIKAAEIDPMGQTPSRPTQHDPQEPLNKETEELQKKGALRKAEEDSFNLM